MIQRATINELKTQRAKYPHVADGVDVDKFFSNPQNIALKEGNNIATFEKVGTKESQNIFFTHIYFDARGREARDIFLRMAAIIFQDANGAVIYGDVDNRNIRAIHFDRKFLKCNSMPSDNEGHTLMYMDYPTFKRLHSREK